jgi:methyl-accepting chemotaxis protein
MFKSMKLGTKLIGGFAVVGLITLTLGFICLNGISNIATTSEHLSFLGHIENQMLQREIDHLNWARKVGEFQRDESIVEVAVEKDDHKCGFGKWYYGEERKLAENAIPELSDLLKRIENPHKLLHQSAVELESLLKKGRDHRNEAVALYGSETSRQLKEVQKILGEIRPVVAKKIEAARSEARDENKHTRVFSIAVMIASVILAVSLGFFLSLSITRPVNRVVSSLSEAAEQVSSASSQVSSASQSLAEGSSEQAASIEETSSSLEEMSSMTKQNADNASAADKLMKESRQMVDKANNSMIELTQSMEDISKASDETSKIIKTIDEIAFQTNLLALNAAVEAARAGEAGAGFAVVANEVRNLAMRAADAARNTSGLIEGTVKKVKQGSELLGRTNEAFSGVSKSAAKVADLVSEIAAASTEQAQGIDQINKAVTEMDKVTQQNAANAEESASASEQMNAQAAQMKQIAEELHVIVQGAVS